MNISKKGFTLAEILVTLVIVGIIAAVAIPTLTTKYRRTEVETRLKKAFSTLSQASMTAKALGNDWGEWAASADARPNWSNIDDEKYFYETCLKPYVSTLRIGNYWNSYLTAYFADGMRLYVGKGGCADLHIDINGDKGPDEYGVDIFVFNYCPTASAATFETDKLIPYATKTEGRTVQEAIDLCKSDRYKCSKSIFLNGWRIPKNYPYSL